MTNNTEKTCNGNGPRIGFNMSTIREYKLTLEEDLEIVYQAGYRHVELWSNKIREYLDRGKTLSELKKWLDDHEMKVENLIGFATWIMDEEAERTAGLKTMKEEMEIVAALGGGCIAACAAGPWKTRIEGLDVIADRYREVLKLGKATGVRPLLELWGTSPTLSRLDELVSIAIATKMDNAALLLDFYHVFRGGNSFDSLGLIAGSALPVFHINDYPAQPAREELTDRDRVYPGDGICPLPEIIRTLVKNGFNGVLSLELFNLEYQNSMTPLEVAKKGYEKVQRVLEQV